MNKICFVTTVSSTVVSFILPLIKYMHENTDWDISVICSDDDEFAKMLPDYVHVAVGAHVCGTVSIGNNTWIGAGATVSNNINICSDCFVGAGAVVVKDIADSGVYIGVPAKKCKICLLLNVLNISERD